MIFLTVYKLIMINYIGWLATSLTIMSFIPKGENKIRFINAIACVVWIFYGFHKQESPIIVVNTIVLILHVFYFITNNSNKKLIS